jgi:cell wall-associated NlpC family hydrolase
MRRPAAVFFALALLAGCAMKPAPLYRDQTSSLEAQLPRVSRDDLLNEISMYHGVRYEEGGNSLSGMDCSGLVHSVFGSLGVSLPRTAREQFAHGIPLGRRDVRTGDLVFFGSPGSPGHVGIAVSNREMMHASSSRGVVLEDIDSFSETSELAGVRRIVRLR